MAIKENILVSILNTLSCAVIGVALLRSDKATMPKTSGPTKIAAKDNSAVGTLGKRKELRVEPKKI